MVWLMHRRPPRTLTPYTLMTGCWLGGKALSSWHHNYLVPLHWNIPQMTVIIKSCLTWHFLQNMRRHSWIFSLYSHLPSLPLSVPPPTLLLVQPAPLSSFHTMPFLSSSDPRRPLPSYCLARSIFGAGDTERQASVKRFLGWGPEGLWRCVNIRGWAHMCGEPFAEFRGVSGGTGCLHVSSSLSPVLRWGWGFLYGS